MLLIFARYGELTLFWGKNAIYYHIRNARLNKPRLALFSVDLTKKLIRGRCNLVKVYVDFKVREWYESTTGLYDVKGSSFGTIGENFVRLTAYLNELWYLKKCFTVKSLYFYGLKLITNRHSWSLCGQIVVFSYHSHCKICWQ